MTAIADPAPLAVDPPPEAQAFLAPTPVATIAADLMPEEIRVKRRLGYLKRRLVFVMAALVALAVLGDLLVRQQTSSAQDQLSGANNHIATLTEQLHGFDKVLSVEGETQAIWTQLAGVLGDDVSWPALLNELTAPAPAGVRLTTIGAQLNSSTSTGTGVGSAAGGTTSPLTTGTVGSITVSGNAPNWRAVAGYVRGLSASKDFTAVNPSTVSHGADGGGSGLTFTVTLDLTSSVLSGRYDPAAATKTSKDSHPAGTRSSTSASGSTTGSTTTQTGSRSTTTSPGSGSTSQQPTTTLHTSKRHHTRKSKEKSTSHAKRRHRSHSSGAGSTDNGQEAS